MSANGKPVTRIAMWSGPRNISTAMMRAWENRPDTAVVDEPLYAHYLARTGLDHPGREEVIAAGNTDWKSVVRVLTGPVPGGKRIWYQKHMAHHLLPHIGLSWLDDLTHCFLIRHPREVVLSYIKARPDVTAGDIGLPQQASIFSYVIAGGHEPPIVIDSGDFLQNPGPMLEAVCDRLGLPFTVDMLSWPPGPRATDGVWAKHWYAAVEKSTGFEARRARAGEVPARFSPVVDECLPMYECLYENRLTV